MIDLTIWNALLALLTGYLIGSIPTGVLVAGLTRSPDPRTVGSGHSGGLNVYRSVGLAGGIVTTIIDAAKGIVVVWLVQLIVPSPWVIPLSGTAAVAGHCWPLFARYRGGMGLATSGGLALRYFPLVLPIEIAFYFLLQRALHHRARAIMLDAALIPLILVLLRTDPPRLALGVGISIVLIIRWASDFHRVYD